MRVWDSASGMLLNTLQEHTMPVLGVAFRNNDTIVSVSQTKICVHDLDLDNLNKSLRTIEVKKGNTGIFKKFVHCFNGSDEQI